MISNEVLSDNGFCYLFSGSDFCDPFFQVLGYFYSTIITTFLRGVTLKNKVLHVIISCFKSNHKKRFTTFYIEEKVYSNKLF